MKDKDGNETYQALSTFGYEVELQETTKVIELLRKLEYKGCFEDFEVFCGTPTAQCIPEDDLPDSFKTIVEVPMLFGKRTSMKEFQELQEAFSKKIKDDKSPKED